jgi:hypothetical protein
MKIVIPIATSTHVSPRMRTRLVMPALYLVRDRAER